MASLDQKKTPIQEFYSGKSILITGCTGFLGKVLLEVLLRKFPDLMNIYLLIRSNKGTSAKKRFEKLINECPLYDKFPQNLKKILVPIESDMCKSNLGLSDEDRLLIIENVNIIFHSAATVRFDEKIKTAIDINVKGLMSILKLGKEMKNLKAFIYVSTAYTNFYRDYIEEKWYKSHMKLEEIHALTKIDDPKILDILDLKLKGPHNNSYTFTKSMAEDLINEESKDLPIAIFRPVGILGASEKHPNAAFVDNITGIPGIFYAIEAGIVRVLLARSDNKAHCIPVDNCVNVMIIAAWNLATNKHDKPPIYNFTTEDERFSTFKHVAEAGHEFSQKHCLAQYLWWPSLSCTDNEFIFRTKVLFNQVIPSLLADIFMKITYKKPIFMNIQRQAFKRLLAHRFSMLCKFTLEMARLNQVKSKMCPEDLQHFYTETRKFCARDYFPLQHKGICNYIFKQTTNEEAIALKKREKLKYIHYTIIYFIKIIIITIIIIWVNKYILYYKI